jgi:hypothetical protein
MLPSTVHARLRYALLTGKVTKPDRCQVCDRTPEQAAQPLTRRRILVAHHHAGYANALDVWWVCWSCNNRLPCHDGSLTLDEARVAQLAGGTIDRHALHVARALQRDEGPTAIALVLLRSTLAEAAIAGANTEELTVLASTWPWAVPGADVPHEVERAEAWAQVQRMGQRPPAQAGAGPPVGPATSLR